MKQSRFLLIGFSLCLVLLTTLLPASAQDAWFAYLYNDFDRELVRVDLNGNQQVYNIGVAEEVYVSGWDMAFTSDGRLATYCSSIYTTNLGGAPTTLHVRDVVAQNDIMQFNLGDTFGCQTFEESFSPNGDLVAVGVVNYFPEEQPADTTVPMWQLLVVDVATGTIVHELNPDLPLVTSAGITIGTPLMPEVRRFTDEALIFAEVLWSASGATDTRTYRWDYGTDTLDLIENWGQAGLNYLDPTGELAWTAHNPDLPAGNTGGPVPANNVIQISENGGEARTIFTSPAFVILDTQFINNGQQLAVLTMPSFDPNNDAQNFTLAWIALNRDGTLAGLHDNLTSGDIEPAPNGYVLYEVAYSGTDFGDVSLSLTYFQNGQQSTLWQSNADGWQLVWASPTETQADLAPFPSIP